MRLHHVGIVVTSIDAEAPRFESLLGLHRCGPVVHDPLQAANLVMLGNPTRGQGVELIEPSGENSPVARLAAAGGGMAHLCYEVDDLASELSRQRNHGSLVVRPPTPAALFGGLHVAFVFTKMRLLVELVESAPHK